MDDMADGQDEDIYLFQNGYGQTPAFPAQTFDDFLPTSPNTADSVNGPVFLNPNDLTIKRETDEKILNKINNRQARSPPSSNGSSRSSSSNSAKQHNRNVSEASTAASRPAYPLQTATWGSGINGLSMPSGDDLFADTDMSGLEDYEASNQQMASDFDFETAASTPSGFNNSSAPQPYRPTAAYGTLSQVKSSSPRVPGTQSQFYFGGSREASPLSAMLPTSQAPSPWSKQSPSSGLEETFNGITMNGDSPGHATFSPNLQFSSNGLSFDPESSSTPSTFAKDVSSPPSTINSADGSPILTVYPTSLKSRVETQIPIRMVLSPLPQGAKKLRLPTHTVSKPKFLAKPEVEKSLEILELHTSLVCSSAMQDPVRMERAFARARGEDLAPLNRSSPTSSIGSTSTRDDEEKPLNGGEVRICSGCIQRERKRASRKKQKKPDEEEMFQKDEEKRVVVFNTNEVKDWVEPNKDSQSGPPNTANGPPAPFPPGAMQVELPMRIACYCRHQNEKLGFQVIFTIKDFRDKVIAQAITNSIMITDDHKTHNAPPSLQHASAGLPTAPQLPGAGVFSTSGMEMQNTPNHKLFKQSFSTTDLHGLQHNFNPNFPMTPTSNPFAIPSTQSTVTSTTMTPRNLSRPASPSCLPGPTTKRRKQSGSGKLPSTLTMTRLEISQIPSGSATMPNTTASSPFAPNLTSFMSQADRGFAIPASRPTQFGTSPPTPNGHETGFMSNINRSFSFENIARQAIISAPNSRQPSRPNSPGSNRNSLGGTDSNFGQGVTNQLIGQPSRRPPPLIHKVVPAEGTMTGGTEVTLLGNGFYQGLEVMFGDTEATTTTYWGEKCLNCITPPAIQPGVVTVIFKHEHPQYSSLQSHSQSRYPVFTYIDDREMELYRLALSTVGKQMPHPTDDPVSAAQQLLTPGGSMQTAWPAHGGYGGLMGQSRQAVAMSSSQTDILELESHMLCALELMDRYAPSGSSTRFDHRRPTGLTLLHLASSLGLTRFVAALLSRGANANALDNNGNTAMHHAAMNGHTHIIHRLRLAGADHRIRSIRNFIPADLATSLLAHQATVIHSYHYRSRSSGGSPIHLHSRNTSSTSLRSFWEQASTSYPYSDESVSSDTDDSSSVLEPPRPNNRASRDSIEGPRVGVAIEPHHVREENCSDHAGDDIPQPVTADERPLSPAISMMAWRNSLAAQINHFQESTQWAIPNLPNLGSLPALPTLPDYQGNPMVRRVSSLFPQRPAARQQMTHTAKEGWWESLTRSSSPSSAAPPAYNELFPNEETQDDFAVKKTSTIQAAADAIADLHFETEYIRGSSARKPLVRPHGTGSETRKISSRRQIQRVELSRDRKLFFFWVSLIPEKYTLLANECLDSIISDSSCLDPEEFHSRSSANGLEIL
jgi:IPT/TIG domain/Ankyrin repeats (many copies)